MHRGEQHKLIIMILVRDKSRADTARHTAFRRVGQHQRERLARTHIKLGVIARLAVIRVGDAEIAVTEALATDNTAEDGAGPYS